MATIQDVAKCAGVGIGTVSRVLNNEKGVSEDTRGKVLAAIDKLRYTRNSLAVSFRKNENRVAALLVPVLDHPFFAKLAYYIEDELDKNGYSLIVSSSQSRQSKEYAMIEKLKRRDVDGIIFVTHYDYKDEAIADLPVVSIDRHFKNVPFITSDNYDSSRTACEWLVSQGCRNIAYIGGKTLVESEVMERARAYEDVMRERGLPVILESKVIKHGEEGPLVEELFANNPGLDGVFASGDAMTHAIIRHCEETGKDIPAELKVVSYDGVDIRAGELRHKIAFVEQPVEEIARASVRTLIAKIRKENTPLKTQLKAKFIHY